MYSCYSSSASASGGAAAGRARRGARRGVHALASLKVGSLLVSLQPPRICPSRSRITPKVDTRQMVVMILGCFPHHRRPSIHWMLRTQLTPNLHIIRHHLSIRYPRIMVVTMTMCSWRVLTNCVITLCGHRHWDFGTSCFRIAARC